MAYKGKKEFNKPTGELTDARLDITKRVLECMKEARDKGTEYERGWFVSNEFPYNCITKKRYRGVNIMSLLADGYEDPRFITSGEISNLFKETEGKVRIKKGEKASRILFAKPRVGNEDSGETVEPGNEANEKTFQGMIYKYHSVFNVSQLEGLDIINEKFPRRAQRVLNEFEENSFVKEVATAMEKTGLKIDEHSEGKACYIPALDAVKMPAKHRFENESLHGRTKLHECGHATGHPSRCNRKQVGAFGSKEYAYEELVAELFSFYMGMETGLGYDRRTHDNHSAYLNSWIDAMTENSDEAKKYIISAASKAFDGFDFVMGKVNELRAEKSESKEASNVVPIGVKQEAKAEEGEVTFVKRKKAVGLAM